MLERVKSREGGSRNSLLRMSWIKPGRDSKDAAAVPDGPEAPNASNVSLNNGLPLARTRGRGADGPPREG